jgi:hypothetical protein
MDTDLIGVNIGIVIIDVDKALAGDVHLRLQKAQEVALPKLLILHECAILLNTSIVSYGTRPTMTCDVPVRKLEVI